MRANPPASALLARALLARALQAARPLISTAPLTLSSPLPSPLPPQGSLPALLQLAGAGAERLYATELDRLSLLLRPDRTAATRLASRGQRPESIAGALGVWTNNLKAALPTATLLHALRAALVEVAQQQPPLIKTLMASAAQAPSAAPALSARSPLGMPPATPATPSTPSGTPRPPAVLLTPDEERDVSTVGTLSTIPEGETVATGGAVRLQGAKRRTLVLRKAELGGGSLQLIDCHSCYVYALASVRTAELLGCSGCTVVVG